MRQGWVGRGVSRVSVPLVPPCCVHLGSPKSFVLIRSFLANADIQLWKNTVVKHSADCLGRDRQGGDKPEREGDGSSDADTSSVLKWGKAHKNPCPAHHLPNCQLLSQTVPLPETRREGAMGSWADRPTTPWGVPATA